jgi:hypothetical protein
MRRSICVFALLLAVPCSAAVANPGTCVIVAEAGIDQRVSDCTATSGPGRAQYNIVTLSESTGSWTVTWRRLSDGVIVGEDNCDIDGEHVRCEFWANPSWSDGAGGSHLGAGLVAVTSGYNDARVAVSMTLTVGPNRAGAPFRGVLQFSAGGSD